MIEQIEKLKETKAKMIAEFEVTREKHKSEIKKIDKAVKKFSEGYAELEGNILKVPKRSMWLEIEKFLSDGKPRHIQEIIEALTNSTLHSLSSVKYQSVSSILQNKVKEQKLIKVLPATYALILIESKSNNKFLQIDDDDKTLSSEILIDDDFEF